MTARVLIPRAEAAVAEFLAETFCPCQEWVAQVMAALREALDRAADVVPASVKADEALLADRGRKIGNLIDGLADGSLDSAAVRQRLKELEREADEIRTRIAENRSLCRGGIMFPDDPWIQEQLCAMGPLLNEDVGRAATLLRQLLGRVTAEDVVAAGKQRGFIRLRFQIDPEQVARAALGDRVPEAIMKQLIPTLGNHARELHLDLGGPNRRDVWAPEIDSMRKQGMTWEQIGRVTGLGTGNAYNVWKRYVDARPRGGLEAG
jgi:hypothetical protein